MTAAANKANNATFISLIIITLLSLGGIVTSVHLVDLHYKQPGRVDKLVEKFPALKPVKKILPKRFLQPAPVDMSKPAKTVKEELKQQYDPWGQYQKQGSGENAPVELNEKAKKQLEKKKETCDVSKELSCSTVDDSKYSEIAGIGVSVYGVAGYVLMFVLGIIALLQRAARPTIFVLMIYAGALIGFAFSIYLTYLEAYKIKSFCPYCLVSAGIMAVIFLICAIGFTKGVFRRLAGK